MSYLADTHTLLWALFTPDKLSQRVKRIVRSGKNEIHVSAISFWEISLKAGLGKLTLKNIRAEELPDAAEEAGFHLLPLTPHEASDFGALPRAHKDPFDRMLVLQCLQNRFTLLSKDAGLDVFTGLKRVW